MLTFMSMVTGAVAAVHVGCASRDCSCTSLVPGVPSCLFTRLEALMFEALSIAGAVVALSSYDQTAVLLCLVPDMLYT